MEKKLITFDEIKSNCKYLYHEDNVCGEKYPKDCNQAICPIWQNLEMSEEKITIVPANGAKRNGWM